jgi:hypothetical protein
VIRYGQDRRFEARPDGIVLPHAGFYALYDAKAYHDGYKVTAGGIRQFQSYVDDFTRRYDSYLPRLNAFLVISGHFPHRDTTLLRRSQEFIAQCGVPLCFLTTGALAQMVEDAARYPSARRAIDWRRVFADPVGSPQRLVEELGVVSKDLVVRGE